MFRPELKQSHKSTQGEEAADEAFALLDETVAACLAANTIKPVDKDVLAIGVWSLVHGLASLWLDGQLNHFRRPGRHGRSGGRTGHHAHR